MLKALNWIDLGKGVQGAEVPGGMVLVHKVSGSMLFIPHVATAPAKKEARDDAPGTVSGPAGERCKTHNQLLIDGAYGPYCPECWKEKKKKKGEWRDEAH